MLEWLWRLQTRPAKAASRGPVPVARSPWPFWLPEHLDWFRQVPEELMLVDALSHPDKYRELLGREAWFSMMLPLLSRVRVESLAIIGFEHEPRPCRDAWQTHDDYAINVSDSPGDTYRAVEWTHPAPGLRRLWIDGRAIVDEAGAPLELVGYGTWLSEDLFVAELPGPDDHPAQDFGFGGWPVILGLLVVDAGRGRTHVLQPTATERWTDPRLREQDGRWHVHATDSATEPDRVIDPAA